MSEPFQSHFLQEDHEFFERELASFLPDRIFDAHTHVYHHDHSKFRNLHPDGVGFEQYRALMDEFHPGRLRGALFIPFPADRDAFAVANEWTSKAVNSHEDYRGIFFIRPEDDPEWVRDEVRRLGLHGLKCYHSYSSTEPTWESDIEDFLPERLVKVAHEEGWVITLHMVKSRAVADPANIRCIRHYCETYPNMRLILAHSARGFQPAHNFEGLPHLVGLDNVYFDTSAICEPLAHQTIIRMLGHERLMYGSDLPVSHSRGRSLGAGDSFIWLSEETPVWEERHRTIPPILVGLEQLRALKWACWAERLSDQQVEDIFYNNAAKLLNVAS